MTHTWQFHLKLWLLVIAGLAGVQSGAAQSSERQSGLAVHVRNYAQVDAKKLVKAKSMALVPLLLSFEILAVPVSYRLGSKLARSDMAEPRFCLVDCRIAQLWSGTLDRRTITA